MPPKQTKIFNLNHYIINNHNNIPNRLLLKVNIFILIQDHNSLIRILIVIKV